MIAAPRHFVSHFLSRSIRRQLVLGIALVHAVLMTIFVFDLVHRQRSFLHEQTAAQAMSLSRTLAAAGAPWMLANDLVGMEELLQGFAHYPDLRYAMLLSPAGRVLAHTRAGVAGRYLADPVSLRLLAASPVPQVLVKDGHTVDVAMPILQDAELVGWARIGLGDERQSASLHLVTREGLIYTGAAILIGTLFALFMARGLTRGLYALLRVADAVRAGRRDLRTGLARQDEIGQVAGALDSMVDTLQGQEGRLMASEARWRNLLQGIHAAVVVHDRESRIKVFNAEALALLGVAPAQMLGKSAQDPQWHYLRADGSDMPVAEYPVSRVVASHAPVRELTLGVRRPEHGDVTWVLVHADPVFREGGALHEVIVSFIDITQRKLAEDELAGYRDHLERLVAERTAALEESFINYRTVANFTNDWETWLGEDGQYRYVSPSCLRITGYAAEEFQADPDLMLRILVAADRERIVPHFRGETDPNAQVTLEFRIQRRDGREVWIEHACQPVYDEAGRYLGRRASNRDITEHKRQAEALAQARDQAEAANRAKSVFLANMSHELRTPLNAILGFAQIMERDDGLSAEQQRNLGIINRSGQHLLELINDVLEISRIEAGRAAIQNEAFDLDDSLRAIEEMTRVRADAKGLAFSVAREGALPRYVSGDAPRLRQVLLNLLSNAVKYTDQGGIALRIQALDGERLRFAVRDTGPGIPAEEQARIFQAFYQTSAGAARGDGAGLGLAISSEYARLMGGELTLDSQPGRGSEFAFTLVLPEAAEAPSSAGAPYRVVRLQAQQAPIPVLVVEDQPDNRELLTHLLETVGFQVRTASNGQEAVERFLAEPPRFIWMDMRMPVLDGYQATRRIRALPGGGAVKIVALTASAFRENREDILAAGCDDMLAKPLDENRIYETMARLLGVRYDYAAGAIPATAPAGAPAPLPPLSAPLRQALRAAAEALDVEAALGAIEQIRRQQPEAAASLKNLVEAYRFDAILGLLEAAGAG